MGQTVDYFALVKNAGQTTDGTFSHLKAAQAGKVAAQVKEQLAFSNENGGVLRSYSDVIAADKQLSAGFEKVNDDRRAKLNFIIGGPGSESDMGDRPSVFKQQVKPYIDDPKKIDAEFNRIVKSSKDQGALTAIADAEMSRSMSSVRARDVLHQQQVLAAQARGGKSPGE